MQQPGGVRGGPAPGGHRRDDEWKERPVIRLGVMIGFVAAALVAALVFDSMGIAAVVIAVPLVYGIWVVTTPEEGDETIPGGLPHDGTGGV